MKSNSPKVSVVIPTFNRRESVCASIHSVLGQSYQNFELIVVDDGSEDRTAEKVQTIGDARLSFIRLEAKSGAAAARNVGIEVSSGEIIAFCDSDDQWLAGRLDKAICLLQYKEDVVGTFSSYLILNAERVFWKPTLRPRKTYFPSKYELAERSVVGTPTLTVRRNALQAIGGFDEALPRFQDWDLAIRLRDVGRIAMLAEPLVVASASTNSISNEKNAYVKAILALFDKHRDFIATDNKLDAIWRLRRGYCLFHSHRLFAGLSECLKAVFRAPLSVAKFIIANVSKKLWSN